MACSEEWLEIVSACHDGEATPDEVSRAREHLAGCIPCRTARARFRMLGDALRSAGHNLVEERGAARPITSTALRPVRRRLLAAALVAAVSALVLTHRNVNRGNSAVVDELEARHLTAFDRASPRDFESTDPAAVRSWIADHFGQSVEVPTVPGARLLGARRCSLSGTTTVSLMYRRGGEPVSLFVPPPGTATAAENVRLAHERVGCTVGRLGATVCARPGLFAVAETAGTALAALDSN